MKENRTKNASRNIVFGLINKVIRLVFPFIIRSIIIQILGAEYLGLDSLFTSILQVLNLAELGFSSAVTYNMYKPIAKNDTKTICALLNLYRKIYRIISVAILVAGIAVMPFLGYFIEGDIPENINIYILYAIFLANTVFSYLVFAYKAVLFNAHQRSDITMNIQSIISVIQYLAQILVLVVFKNYYLFAGIMCITTIINNILASYFAKKKYPQYVCAGEISKTQRKDIRKKVTGLMVYRICATTRNSFDSIFISSMVGLTEVAIYSNYYTIMAGIMGIMGALTTPVIASVGNSIVTETEKKNYRDMVRFDFIYMWVSGWLAICLACLYQPLMKLWMGEENMFEYGIMILFCIYFYALKMGDIRALYADARGLWYENRFRTIAESVVNIILNLVLGYFFGVPGIIVATLISLLIIGFGGGAQILFKHYFVHEKVSKYFLRHLIYALVTTAVGALTYFSCTLVQLDGIWELVVKAAICVSLPNLVYLLIYRNTKTYKDSLSITKNIW